MYTIDIPKGINNMISLFYYIGIWHRGDKPTIREMTIKLFYSIYYLLFPISLIAGANTAHNKEESIFLAEVTFATCVMSLKLFYLIWNKEKILEMLTNIGVYSMENRDEFTLANDKLKRFMKFATILLFVIMIGSYTSLVIPIFAKERKLFLNIGFPLDYKNDDIAFWMADAFLFTEISLSIIAILFCLIFWYLMINCAVRYEILGCQIRNMGAITTATNERAKIRKMSDKEKRNLFLRDVVAAIDSHQNIRKLVNQLAAFLSDLFFIQIITSGLCICGSVYSLAFDVGENLVERILHLVSLVYYISDIFMIMYYGNEIKLSSDRLSYCLFESNWVDQPQRTIKCAIIFGEVLRRPHELVVGKLYPLTLEMFRRILNFAYNTFNILKNVK